MNDLVLRSSEQAVAEIEKYEDVLKELPQIQISTQHLLHGGMYSRTILIPEGTFLTGVKMDIPTVLIIDGDVSCYANEEWTRVIGYQVLGGEKGRKGVFTAHMDTYLTMIFPTSATTVEEAENEFTLEAEKLASRKDEECQEHTLQLPLSL